MKTKSTKLSQLPPNDRETSAPSVAVLQDVKLPRGAKSKAAHKLLKPTPKQEPLAAGYVELDRAQLVGLSSFEKLTQVPHALYYYLPEAKGSSPWAALLRAVRDVGASATNFVTEQQRLATATDELPGIWSPGTAGFPPVELETRLSAAIKPFESKLSYDGKVVDVSLSNLPTLLRMAGKSLPKISDEDHRRLNYAANVLEQRADNPGYQLLLKMPLIGRVTGPEATWTLQLSPKNGMSQLKITEGDGLRRPGHPRSPLPIVAQIEALPSASLQKDDSAPTGFDAPKRQPLEPPPPAKEPPNYSNSLFPYLPPSGPFVTRDQLIDMYEVTGQWLEAMADDKGL